jgi:hypothetical protein
VNDWLIATSLKGPFKAFMVFEEPFCHLALVVLAPRTAFLRASLSILRSGSMASTALNILPAELLVRRSRIQNPKAGHAYLVQKC